MITNTDRKFIQPLRSTTVGISQQQLFKIVFSGCILASNGNNAIDLNWHYGKILQQVQNWKQAHFAENAGTVKY